MPEQDFFNKLLKFCTYIFVQTHTMVMFLHDVSSEGSSPPSSKFISIRPIKVILDKASSELKGAKLE